jgi:hypothetical protein
MPKPILVRRRIKKQTIPKSKINPFIESAKEKKYKNKISINPENIMEDFEKLDFLKDLIDNSESNSESDNELASEFVRQLNAVKKDLKKNAFIASIENATYQQLLEARAARVIKARPQVVRRRIENINQKMRDIFTEIKEIEDLHEQRKPHVKEKKQLKKLEEIKEMRILKLRKEYSDLIEEKEYITKLARLTNKEIAELENIK